MEKGGDELPDDFTFSLEKAMIMINYWQKIFILKGILSVVKRIEFISVRMSPVTVRCRGCNTMLNVRSLTKK